MIRLQHDTLQSRVSVGVFQRDVRFELIEKRYHRFNVPALGGEVQWRHLAIVGEARDLHVDVARVASAEHLKNTAQQNTLSQPPLPVNNRLYSSLFEG